MDEWVWLSLRCGWGKDSENLAVSAAQPKSSAQVYCWFSCVLERLLEVCKGSQICMIIALGENNSHLMRKAEEGGLRKKWQLRWWHDRWEEHITSPEEVTILTDSCLGEPSSVFSILTPLGNLCSEWADIDCVGSVVSSGTCPGFCGLCQSLLLNFNFFISILTVNCNLVDSAAEAEIPHKDINFLNT